MLLIISRTCYQELNYSSNLTSFSLLPKSLVVTCLELRSRTFNREHILVNPAQMWQRGTSQMSWL